MQRVCCVVECRARVLGMAEAKALLDGCVVWRWRLLLRRRRRRPSDLSFSWGRVFWGGVEGPLLVGSIAVLLSCKQLLDAFLGFHGAMFRDAPPMNQYAFRFESSPIGSARCSITCQ